MLPISLPKDFILDVHDLAAVIKNEYARSDTRFSKAHMIEINRGDAPLLTLPQHILPPEWDLVGATRTQKRVAYFVRADSEEDHEACITVLYKRRPDLSPTRVDMDYHRLGLNCTVPWIYLMLGKPVSADLYADTRVVLDLALPQIGSRGGGEELFALERGFEYHNKVLARYADEFEDLKVSRELRLSPEHIRKQGDKLADIVMERLSKRERR